MSAEKLKDEELNETLDSFYKHSSCKKYVKITGIGYMSSSSMFNGTASSTSLDFELVISLLIKGVIFG